MFSGHYVHPCMHAQCLCARTPLGPIKCSGHYVRQRTHNVRKHTFCSDQTLTFWRNIFILFPFLPEISDPERYKFNLLRLNKVEFMKLPGKILYLRCIEH